MTEKQLEHALKVRVKVQTGGEALKLFSASFTGLPDRMILMPGGRVAFAELKSPGKKPSPRQLVAHRFLQKLGFEVRVIDSLEGLEDFINFLKFAH